MNGRCTTPAPGAPEPYLIEQKIPLTAVDTVGLGESGPIASNATADGRQKNRRVELVVTGDSIGREDARSTAQ